MRCHLARVVIFEIGELGLFGKLLLYAYLGVFGLTGIVLILWCRVFL
jgi:hypothetical protein